MFTGKIKPCLECGEIPTRDRWGYGFDGPYYGCECRHFDTDYKSVNEWNKMNTPKKQEAQHVRRQD